MNKARETGDRYGTGSDSDRIAN